MSTPDTNGYNEAERQFHEKDQEALRALRAKLDAQRVAAKAAAEKAAHWMRCPKCGSQMKEVAMGGVIVDQCGSCGGVYFDAGEFDARRRAQEVDWTWSMVRDAVLDGVLNNPAVRSIRSEVDAQVRRGELTPALAAERILAAARHPHNQDPIS